MRIISGTARGRRVKSLKGTGIRPTADRVKEAMFNILSLDPEGARVLDLFAGSGNLSLEALSRGAASVLLVESSRSAAELIQQNLTALGFLDRSSIWVKPVLSALRQLASQQLKYHVILMDPPYEGAWVGRVLAAIDEGKLLAANGVVVAEHSRREAVAETYGSLALKDQRRYGDTHLSFFVSGKGCGTS